MIDVVGTEVYPAHGRRFVLLAWQGVGFVPLVYWSGTRTRKGQRFHPACSWLRSDVGMVVSSRLYSLCLQGGEGGRALIARLYASWECTEERRYLDYGEVLWCNLGWRPKLFRAEAVIG
ncbi:hypothetical protein AHAS_Ahas20G0181300 [Arachis hypogaea]